MLKGRTIQCKTNQQNAGTNGVIIRGHSGIGLARGTTVHG
jgi:hypothetical protein